MEIEQIEKMSQRLRIQILNMYKNAGGGHFGGSFSVIDILTALYFGGIIKLDPMNPDWKERDRLVLSKGHACGALCSCLAERGFFPAQLLDTFNKLESPFGMHPDMNKICGCDMSTGSLGHGLSSAVGMALAARMDKSSHRIFAVLGDTEMQSGMTYEALMAAGNFGLDNLIMILDRNQYSLDGATESIMPIEPLLEKFAALKWATASIDGHDHEMILESLNNVPIKKGMPSAIIANTIKGKGVSFMENTHSWHYKTVNDDQYDAALKELNISNSV